MNKWMGRVPRVKVMQDGKTSSEKAQEDSEYHASPRETITDSNWWSSRPDCRNEVHVRMCLGMDVEYEAVTTERCRHA